MKKDNGRGLEALARKGRGGDTEIGHLTEGELVVPVSILARFPEARDALFHAFREAGIDPDRYIVGAEENSVNPKTGVREFGGFDASQDQKDNQAGGPAGNPRDTSQGQDPSDRNRYPTGTGRRMTLPPEYADFILEDGRRLEDVLGKSFFKEGGKLGGFGSFGKFGLLGRKDKQGDRGAHARVLAERQAQARRLNQTKSILTSARGVAGAASTSKNTLTSG